MFAFIRYPDWIKPEIIPGLPVRWYGLMYIVAFAVAYFILIYQVKRDKTQYPKELVDGLFYSGILGLLLGARIFSTLIYHDNFSGYGPNYWLQPWLIFWPFSDGKFVGLQGMSYHGGAVGLVVAIVIYCRVKKLSFRKWADMLALAVPLGYTFGRLGNFINGELWGRVTTAPWGMVFPNATPLSMNKEWVRETASELGPQYAAEFMRNGFINLPRHPSQIYEMIFEGVVLFLLLWFVGRRLKKSDGQIAGFYFIGYGFFRFFIEYFREPDASLGFILGPGRGAGNAPTEIVQSWLNFSMGQLLCFLMMVGGTALVIGSRLYEKKFGAPVENFKIPDADKKTEKKSLSSLFKKKRK